MFALAGLNAVRSVERIAFGSDTPIPLLIVLCGPEPTLRCAEAREVPMLAQVPILAVVPTIPSDAAAAALAAGATDVLEGAPTPAVLGARSRLLIRARKQAIALAEIDALQNALLAIEQLIARGGDAPETLRDVMVRAAETLGYERGSLIAHVEGAQFGYVIAATDDPDHQQFSLLMSDYPELTAALQTHEALIVGDVSTHEITKALARTLHDKGIGSIAVFPVIWRNMVLGAMFFRRAQPSTTPTAIRRVRFGQLLATQLAATLRHGRVMERLRDQTRRISRASYEAERRLRTIESLKEHFEASADGVVVLDGEGRMLFVNGTAEAITGFAGDGLIGTALTDLVHSADREPLESVLRSVLAGTNLEAFDLDLITTGGGTICVSVTTSTVLARSEAVILSFRDVTAQRALEAELEQTKDFLEKLIDSAIDAIVAADMSGRVILFNSGAEAVTGYQASEVLGVVPIAELYPDKAESQVLSMLRSPEHGGVGRLETTHREILSKHGERIPVNMTASIIYEDGNEVATVGIFTDLRERLLMEEQLVETQRQLREREKQAAIADLAGAAAHELNQPLTSILASASMLVRSNDSNPTTARRLDVIIAEAERMAELVRKIGRIVRYETKEYVGSSSILDLERSTRGDSIDTIIENDSDSDSEGGDGATAAETDEGTTSGRPTRVPDDDTNPLVQRSKIEPLPAVKTACADETSDETTDEDKPKNKPSSEELPGPPHDDEVTAEHRFSKKVREWAKTLRIKPLGDKQD